MTPAARVQAAIDLLDAVIVAARDDGAAADGIAQAFFKTRRYMGSGDRRAVRALAYRAIRRFGARPASGRAAMLGLAREDAELAALFDGSGYGPAAIAPDEPVAGGGALPGWIAPHLPDLLGADERAALLDRAPLDLRFDPRKTDAASIRAIWPDAAFHPDLPGAARLPAGTDVQASAPWREGAIEVQDWGSQAIVAACGPLGDGLAIDLCAGAGGKALALAAQHPAARIVASDISRARLQAMAPRQARAGAGNITPVLLDPGREAAALSAYRGQADLVLVDAPCSGTGTWRRNPETRWRLDPARLARLVDSQARLIDLAKTLVRRGGALVYAVCSLLVDEGPSQAARLYAGGGWPIDLSGIVMGRPIAFSDLNPAGFVLTPAFDATDGFFLTRARAA